MGVMQILRLRPSFAPPPRLGSSPPLVSRKSDPRPPTPPPSSPPAAPTAEARQSQGRSFAAPATPRQPSPPPRTASSTATTSPAPHPHSYSAAHPSCPSSPSCPSLPSSPCRPRLEPIPTLPLPPPTLNLDFGGDGDGEDQIDLDLALEFGNAQVKEHGAPGDPRHLGRAKDEELVSDAAGRYTHDPDLGPDDFHGHGHGHGHNLVWDRKLAERDQFHDHAAVHDTDDEYDLVQDHDADRDSAHDPDLAGSERNDNDNNDDIDNVNTHVNERVTAGPGTQSQPAGHDPYATGHFHVVMLDTNTSHTTDISAKPLAAATTSAGSHSHTGSSPTNAPASAPARSASVARQTQVIWNNDRRFPGPEVFHPPAEIGGLPTQDELDGFPRMFSWGELKEIFQSGDLEQLMRNKALQQRYDEWMGGMKVVYGSTENYLKNVRLPWNRSQSVEPTYDLTTSLDNPKPATAADKSKSTSSRDDSKPAPSLDDSQPASSQDDSSTTLTLSLDSRKRASAASGSTGDGDVSTANLTPATSSRGAKPTSHLAKLSTNGTPYSQASLPTLTPAPAPALGRGSGSVPGSGASTPSSAGFVSLASLKLVNGKLRSRSGRSTPVPRAPGTPLATSSGEDDDDEAEDPVYLKWDESRGLDRENFAVLPNDWPYNIPYGVRHYCVWCRIPIAHPELVNYDPALWADIEAQGLLGFTGVTPVLDLSFPASPTSPPSANPSHQVSKTDSAGRAKFIKKLERHQWYSADIAYGGQEAKRWAGVELESPGGREVARMVKGLWDERGWECLWFVNPPRLQSVPGFSHFHVFARRKTPEEIDAAEVAFAQRSRARAQNGEPVTP